MRLQWLVFLLSGCLAYGQASAPTAASSQPGPKAATAPADDAPAPETKVAPGDTVITIKGLCDDPVKQGDACKTSVTREQFEKLANALQPNMSPPIRRQLALTYARMLLMSEAAEKKGLDKTQQFEQMMLYSRMLALSQALGRALQEEAGNISDADIEKYYNDNKAAYDEATLQRIFVPRTRQAPAPKPGVKVDAEAQEKAGQAAMKKVATDLQARAAKGSDFELLEKEAYTAAGFKGNPPTTKMEKTRQSMLPATQKTVLQLKPGEVSELLSDPSGFYIYKMVSKTSLPLDSVKTEIRNTIAGQRYRDAMQAFQVGPNLDLSEAYFGATKNPNMPPPRKGEKPQAEPVDPD